MDAVRLNELARALGGEVRGEAPPVTGVTIDSRKCASGDLFVALRGEHADGHGFVTSLAGHAAAAMVERWQEGELAQWRVRDARATLGELGAWCRGRSHARVVGITGSNGKTTVKELVASILALDGPTLVTPGNYNNELGVPLTLSRLASEHEYAVIEMGASHRGDIAQLAAWVRPEVAVITNAGGAHLKGFGSLEGVALGKGELVESLESGGIAVLNACDEFFPVWRTLATPRRILSFGTDEVPADVGVSAVGPTDIELRTWHGRRHVPFHLPGRHNRLNAAAAAAVAIALDIDEHAIAEGLAAARPVPGRLQPLRGAGGGLLLDDTYNANPQSLEAALEVLAEQSGERWLVLGDMAELGEEAEERHAECGLRAREAGVHRLFAVGPLSKAAATAFGDGGEWFEDADALSTRLNDLRGTSASILVKGSRSAAMERFVTVLAAHDEPSGRGG